MVKRILILLTVFTIGCASFRHNAIPVQVKITDLLDQISSEADKAVSLGIMSKSDRQEFAKQVMLPSIDAAQKVNDCLYSGQCSGISVTLTKFSSTLLTGINTYIAKLPNSDIKISLIAKLNSAITFLTGLNTKIGGFNEEANRSLAHFKVVA